MIKISESDFIDLIHWARRYCDNRSTYAPTAFNLLYERISHENQDLLACRDQFDHTLKDGGKHWPYAQDGQYDENTGRYNAFPKIKS